jgi:hypothetical protein
MVQTLPVPKGQKKLLVRQCLNELGVETSFGMAKKWFMKNHKLTLADATFYHVRKDMRGETAAAKTAPPKQVSKPFVSPLDFSIVEVVLAAQKLVDKLGKEEVRKLIDLL